MVVGITLLLLQAYISSCRRVAGFPSEIPLFVAISPPGVLIEAVIKVIRDVST